jgi:uncharacterized caspase-like protein
MKRFYNPILLAVFIIFLLPPFVRSFRTTNQGLARMDAPTGTFIAYATASGSVAADGPGRNGIFTEHLLRRMTTPGLTIEKVMKLVRSRRGNGLSESVRNWNG